jgi:hypothetical protein
LHGRNVFVVEGSRRRGEHFKNPERAVVVTERRNQNRANAETAATGEVDTRVTIGVVAKHNFAGADRFRRNSGISLKSYAKIRRRTAGAGAADYFVPCAERDRGAGSSCQMLCPFGNGADCRLEIKFSGVNLYIVWNRYRLKSGRRVRSVRDSKLISLRERGHA